MRRATGIGTFTVHADFSDKTRWAWQGRQRRFELRAPLLRGDLKGRSDAMAIACVHGERATLMLNVSGGHLRKPLAELVVDIEREGSARLRSSGGGPLDLLTDVVQWLEGAQKKGAALERTYIRASMVISVGDGEIWNWHAGPQGTAHGMTSGLVFAGTDLRFPVLRDNGLLNRVNAFPAAHPYEAATGIVCVGSSNAYEELVIQLGPGEIVLTFDRGTCPYGPLPSSPTSLTNIWELDAAWKHGLPGYAIAVGEVNAEDLALPVGWTMREVELGT